MNDYTKENEVANGIYMIPLRGYYYEDAFKKGAIAALLGLERKSIYQEDYIKTTGCFLSGYDQMSELLKQSGFGYNKPVERWKPNVGDWVMCVGLIGPCKVTSIVDNQVYNLVTTEGIIWNEWSVDKLSKWVPAIGDLVQRVMFYGNDKACYHYVVTSVSNGLNERIVVDSSNGVHKGLEFYLNEIFPFTPKPEHKYEPKVGDCVFSLITAKALWINYIEKGNANLSDENKRHYAAVTVHTLKPIDPKDPHQYIPRVGDDVSIKGHSLEMYTVKEVIDRTVVLWIRNSLSLYGRYGFDQLERYKPIDLKSFKIPNIKSANDESKGLGEITNDCYVGAIKKNDVVNITELQKAVFDMARTQDAISSQQELIKELFLTNTSIFESIQQSFDKRLQALEKRYGSLDNNMSHISKTIINDSSATNNSLSAIMKRLHALETKQTGNGEINKGLAVLTDTFVTPIKFMSFRVEVAPFTDLVMYRKSWEKEYPGYTVNIQCKIGHTSSGNTLVRVVLVKK